MPNMMVCNMYPLSNMAILGIQVGFRGCNPVGKTHPVGKESPFPRPIIFGYAVPWIPKPGLCSDNVVSTCCHDTLPDSAKWSTSSHVIILCTALEKLMEQIRRSPVEVGSSSNYLQAFIHPRWLFGISSINGMEHKHVPFGKENIIFTSYSQDH